MTRWFDECYRKLFLDYHTQQSAPEVGRDFEAGKWAASLEKAGVQAVSCIAKCGYGWRYYRKGEIGRLHPHLPEGMDILGETIEACHARGIRVIAYYHAFGSEYLAEKRPEWLTRTFDGKNENMAVCMLSPAFEKEMLPQLAEIAENYPADGLFIDGAYFVEGAICYCGSCRKRYLRETGRELPRGVKDARYPLYAEWALKRFAALRARIVASVCEKNPDLLVSFNWVGGTRQVEEPAKGIGFLSADIPPGDMSFYVSYQARNWAFAGVPYDVMNHMSLKWWQEWSVKPPYSLKQEAALALVNGAKTWLGYQMYPWFGLPDYALAALKETFDFVRGLEPLLAGSRVLPYVGVLNGAPPKGRAFADERSLKGVHKLLTRAGIPYNSLTEGALCERMEDFLALVIAGDQPLAKETQALLEGYVYDGGALFLTGKSGMVDGEGAFARNPLLERMAGVAVAEGYPHAHGYIDLEPACPCRAGVPAMPLSVDAPFMFARAEGAEVWGTLRAVYLRADGQPLFTANTGLGTFSPPGEKTGHAALTAHRYGKGLVVYAAGDLFAAYAGGSQWALKRLVKNIVSGRMLGERAIRIDAPDYVEMALMERGDALFIHLVNLTREAPLMDFGASCEYVIGEEPVPIRDIGLRVPMLRAPGRVTLNGRALEYRYEAGVLSLTVARLDIHACVAIEG